MATIQSAAASQALLLTALLAAPAADPAPAPAAAADLQVQVSDVTDTRSLRSSFAGLAIDVRLSGADLAGAEAFRTTLQRASDDTGRSLIQATAASTEFTRLEAGSPPQARLVLKLASPARKASTVGPMAGVIELYVPARDSASVITVHQVAGRPRIEVVSPALRQAGIQLTVVAREEFDRQAKELQGKTLPPFPEPLAGVEAMVEELGKAFLSMLSGLAAESKGQLILRVQDPRANLVRVEVLDAAGKPIPSNGRLTMGELHSHLFSEPLPPTARLRVYAATPRSLVRLPLQLPPIQLPQEPVARRSRRAFSADASLSAQTPVTAMELGERMGHKGAQVLPSLAARAHHPAAVITP